MKFPYGLCDFKKIITQGYVYCDRTGHIPLLEFNKYQLFIRPRRFGKSLLLSMLFNYYDVAQADEFERLFGHLAIGKKPTPLHSQYLVLVWDFSMADPVGRVCGTALFQGLSQSGLPLGQRTDGQSRLFNPAV